MEVRSPRLECFGAPQGATAKDLDTVSGGQTNLIIDSTNQDSHRAFQQKQKRPTSKPNFFNSSTKKLQRSSRDFGQPSEARMDFSVASMNAVPAQVQYYQNITQHIVRPFASYVKGQVGQSSQVLPSKTGHTRGHTQDNQTRKNYLAQQSIVKRGTVTSATKMQAKINSSKFNVERLSFKHQIPSLPQQQQRSRQYDLNPNFNQGTTAFGTSATKQMALTKTSGGDFLSRAKESTTRNIQKYLDMARKPQALSTEDDMKILNSFESATMQNSQESTKLQININNIADTSTEEQPLRVTGNTAKTFAKPFSKNLKETLSKTKRLQRTQPQLESNRGQFLATTECQLHFSKSKKQASPTQQKTSITAKGKSTHGVKSKIQQYRGTNLVRTNAQTSTNNVLAASLKINKTETEVLPEVGLAQTVTDVSESGPAGAREQSLPKLAHVSQQDLPMQSQSMVQTAYMVQDSSYTMINNFESSNGKLVARLLPQSSSKGRIMKSSQLLASETGDGQQENTLTMQDTIMDQSIQ